eukprot:s48_g25.t1
MICLCLQSLYWFKHNLHFAAIMAKRKSPEGEPKKASRAKVKAKAKAKAASQPPEAEPVDDSFDVTRAEVSKFITALKYKAKNPKDPQAQGAQLVLEESG